MRMNTVLQKIILKLRTWSDAAISFVKTILLWHILKHKIIEQLRFIQLRLDACRNDGLHLRAEDKLLAVVVIIQRLHSCPVSYQEKFREALIEDANGEIAVQLFDAGDAHFFVEAQ